MEPCSNGFVEVSKCLKIHGQKTKSPPPKRACIIYMQPSTDDVDVTRLFLSLSMTTFKKYICCRARIDRQQCSSCSNQDRCFWPCQNLYRREAQKSFLHFLQTHIAQIGQAPKEDNRVQFMFVSPSIHLNIFTFQDLPDKSFGPILRRLRNDPAIKPLGFGA